MDPNNQNQYSSQQGQQPQGQAPMQPQVPPVSQPVQEQNPQTSQGNQVQPLAPEQQYGQPYSPDMNQNNQPPAAPPQEPAAPAPATSDPHDIEGGGHKKLMIALILMLLLAAVGAAVAGFFLFGNSDSQTEQALAPSPTPEPLQQPTDQQPTVDPTLQAVQAAIRTQAYNVLIDYLASTVRVRLEATECCGTLSVAETINQLSYLNDATPPWNFDQESEMVQQVKTAQPDLYGDKTLGISENGYFFAYSVNDSGKIDSVSLGADYTLLLPLDEENVIGPRLEEEDEDSTTSASGL